jgi:single-strand DNA-binding protein
VEALWWYYCLGFARVHQIPKEVFLMNAIQLVGRISRITLWQPKEGNSALFFDVAVRRGYKSKKTGRRETDFVPCMLLGKAVEWKSKELKKGDQVEVQGSFNVYNYTKDGKPIRQITAMVKTVEITNRPDSNKNGSDLIEEVSEVEAPDVTPEA